MTDQQYEPTTDDILRCYMQRGGSEEEFNRWYEAELAAAEQRGERRAAKNLRPFVSRVAEHRALIGTETAREAKLLAYELNRLEGDE